MKVVLSKTVLFYSTWFLLWFHYSYVGLWHTCSSVVLRNLLSWGTKLASYKTIAFLRLTVCLFSHKGCSNYNSYPINGWESLVHAVSLNYIWFIYLLRYWNIYNKNLHLSRCLTYWRSRPNTMIRNLPQEAIATYWIHDWQLSLLWLKSINLFHSTYFKFQESSDSFRTWYIPQFQFFIRFNWKMSLIYL